MRTIGIAAACALVLGATGCKSKAPKIEVPAPQQQTQGSSATKRPASKKKATPTMHALGFELGARRADVLAVIEKMGLSAKDLGHEVRAKGPMLGLEAEMSWDFRAARLYTMVFEWRDTTKSMTLQNNAAYRALSASHGAIDKKHSDASYVRWTNARGFVELSYAELKLKVRNRPYVLTLTAKLYEVPDADG